MLELLCARGKYGEALKRIDNHGLQGKTDVVLTSMILSAEYHNPSNRELWQFFVDLIERLRGDLNNIEVTTSTQTLLGTIIMMGMKHKQHLFIQFVINMCPNITAPSHMSTSGRTIYRSCIDMEMTPTLEDIFIGSLKTEEDVTGTIIYLEENAHQGDLLKKLDVRLAELRK